MFRASLSLLSVPFFLSLLSAQTAQVPARSSQGESLAGVYLGQFTCAQVPSRLRLTISTEDNRSLKGLFTFYLPQTGETPYTYTLEGTYTAASGIVAFTPGQWQTAAPPGAVMVGLSGPLDKSGRSIAGNMLHPFCEKFHVDWAEPVPATPISASRQAAAQTVAPGARSVAPVVGGPVPKAEATASATAADQTSGKSKSACDLVPASAVGAVFGPGFYPISTFDRPGTGEVLRTSLCNYKEQAGSGMREVRVYVTELRSPDSESVAKAKKELAQGGGQVQDVPGIGDAALWSSQLDVFTNGTTTISITVSGRLPDANYARNTAVKLSQTALGSSVKTGYVYGIPKPPNAPAIASGSTTPPATPPSPAKTPQPAAPAIATSNSAPPSSTNAATAAAPAATAAARRGPGGLVRKSNAYWRGYKQPVLLKRIFGGDFDENESDNANFRSLFDTYVDTFSYRCHDFLPPNHQSIAVSYGTDKVDRNGNVVGVVSHTSGTVDADPRFVPTYQAYFRQTTNDMRSLVMSVATGKMKPSDLVDSGNDVTKFFLTEGCQSAGVKQLGENLLRASAGKASLQEAGETIPGAEAESDVKGVEGVIKSEIQLLSEGNMGGSIYDVPQGQQAIVRQQVDDLSNKGQKIIRCTYGLPDPNLNMGYSGYDFWYQVAPVNLLALTRAVSNHPFRALGAAVDACPASPALAKQKSREGKPPERPR